MSLEFLSLETVEEIAQQYGYWAVFLGILLENIGFPIPGETVTLAGGFLAGSDQLDYWIVLADATLGAAIGGNIGYWIGRTGGWALLTRVGKLLRVKEPKLLALKQQFSDNAPKAVFLGRFIALLRVFASPLAGIAEMPYPQFLFYNTVGAATWATVMVSLAYFAGQVVPLDQLVGYASKFGLVTFVIIVAWLVVPIWLESRKSEAIATEASEKQD
ncbi:MAG TPA: DedA family protein [Leptolyngbyaceae cyanobacterium M33_DOE_097]|uniref:DedA family protein n=1 Tax=Oscillatoriales cyanobacterium SpSt-418 TaxID=2282169 RepID=A0A7C3KFZ7_9CYAN|nr:DedA family protein [Leptolyngbyaceae cyanobacterium M33_DOE_097]